MNNVGPVHGGLWTALEMEGVYKTLTRNGYSVTGRPKSYDVAGRRRGVHQASSGSKGRACDSRWPTPTVER